MPQPSPIDHPPPHSVTAEQGVLGCILLSPKECFSEFAAELDPDAFFDLRHRSLLRVLAEMWQAGAQIDSITLAQAVKDRGLIAACGGVSYFSALPDGVPSASHIGHYLEIVAEKYRLRKLSLACSEILDRIHKDKSENLIAEAQTRIQSISDSGPCDSEVWSADYLTDYDTKNDPNAVLGLRQDGSPSRFLCRSSGAWFIAQSGAGKSSALMQMATRWALGLPVFGVAPLRPLKVLIVQAENDAGDAAEQLQGALDGMKEFDPVSYAQIQKHLRTVRIRGKTGLRFCQALEREIKAWGADLVIIDPVLAFAGIDLMRQDQCSKFLREWLDPVLARTGVVLIGAHHTAKPRGDSRRDTPQSPLDVAYSGLGSSELVNWPRATMVLMAVENGVFKLSFAGKRGDRAGATHPNGEPAAAPLHEIWLKRSRDRIYWEQIDPPEIVAPVGGEKPKKKTLADRVLAQNLYTLLSACKPEGETFRGVCQRLCDWLATDAQDRIGGQQKGNRSVRDAVSLLIEREWLAQRDGKIYRGTRQ